MPIRINQLYQSAKLESVYLLAGDEPFQQLTATDFLRQRARENGFDERRVFDFSQGKPDWNDLLQASQTLGLFSSRQLIELRLGDKRPNKAGSETLKTVIDQAESDIMLLITTGRLAARDRKSGWYTAIDKAGSIVNIWPVEHRQLPGWTKEQLHKAGLDADTDAIQLLADRSEGNLLALSQEVEKLSILYPDTKLTATHIRDSVADSSHFSIFDLGAATSDKDLERAIRILDNLCDAGEPDSLILWSLSRELHVMEAVSKGQAPGTFMPKARMQALQQQAHQLGTATLQQLLQIAFRADTQIKGQQPGRVRDTLTELVAGMAGGPCAIV